MLDAMELAGFADRARRELLATGETARKRTIETVEELTAQEAQIARLARSGRSNTEISTQLFISPRTVEWHLGKVFIKLGISSRKELRAALPDLDLIPVQAQPGYRPHRTLLKQSLSGRADDVNVTDVEAAALSSRDGLQRMSSFSGPLRWGN
jgi:DNA-binding CsgD family transcriptional regulator